jgi:hypothetical protein
LPETLSIEPIRAVRFSERYNDHGHAEPFLHTIGCRERARLTDELVSGFEKRRRNARATSRHEELVYILDTTFAALADPTRRRTRRLRSTA